MQTPRSQVRIVDDRTSISAEALKRSLLNHLFYLRGKLPETATPHDYYVALVQTVRDRLLSSWMATNQTYAQPQVKRVGYFSSTLFTSTPLRVYLANLGITEQAQQAIEESDLDLESLFQQEAVYPGTEEPGELATYHLDSLTTLALPAIGYGIRYEWDSTDPRLHSSDRSTTQAKLQAKLSIQAKSRHQTRNSWEISRPEHAVTVQFGGTTESYIDEQGRFRMRWLPTRVIWGIPYDTPISGYKTNTVNTLRLWSATWAESLNEPTAANGNHRESKSEAFPLESLIKIPFLHLDSVPTQQTQLQQQFFLLSCSLQDILRIHLVETNQPIETLPNTFTLQLNEIHQAIGIVELMRLLLDEHHFSWEQAWQITQTIFVYTHCPASLEASTYWSIKLFSQLLPRHLEIIYEINQRFLAEMRTKYPEQDDRISRLSLIKEGEERQIRIAHLAFIGSRLVNGADLLQTNLLKQESLRDLYEIFPEKFKHQLDRGLSHRFLTLSNPKLSDLITRNIGKSWTHCFQEISQLEALMQNPEFCQEWRSVKRLNKQSLANTLLKQQHNSIDISPIDTNSLFDIHHKPISQQNRQLLSIFYLITLYNRIKANPAIDLAPRTFIFSKKPELSCEFSTLIIQLIHDVATIVNRDPDTQGRLQVVCFDPLDVSPPLLYAAADLAEQLETADTEFVGLDPLKFALNGAAIIGTLTAANSRFCDQIGETNCFWFGLTAEEVHALRSSGYDPLHYYYNHRELQGAIDRIATGYFSTHDPNPCKRLIDTILDRDEYFLLADYPFYVSRQDWLEQSYKDVDRWTRLSILYTARMGQFSCDRIIQDYSHELWQISSIPIQV